MQPLKVSRASGPMRCSSAATAFSASRYSIPAAYADRLMAEAGGLMSYGSDIEDA
jgi:hypothetical protein